MARDDFARHGGAYGWVFQLTWARQKSARQAHFLV